MKGYLSETILNDSIACCMTEMIIFGVNSYLEYIPSGH